MSWNDYDLIQMKEYGVNPIEIDQQIELFRQGGGTVNLVRACTPSDGIQVLSSQKQNALINLFDELSSSLEISKFVPASGAASRMFKHLHNIDQTPQDQLIVDFKKHFNQFPFAKKILKSFPNFNSDENADWIELIHKLLHSEEFNFANKPKGLIPFHSHNDAPINAFEEHLGEAVAYGRGKGNMAHIHFTVSANFQDEIIAFLEQVKLAYESNSDVHIAIQTSVQKSSTDTIAVLGNNEPYKDDEGKFLFRPGGHGSLIQNLNDIEADLIFIKNIDNVVPNAKIAPTAKYKKVLAGLALELMNKIHVLVDRLHAKTDVTIEAEAYEFVSHWFSSKGCEPTRESLLNKLNKPLRVCGMVKNQGEPGGGPFWTLNEEGEVSTQIIEKAQINMEDESQAEIVGSSTHFNPVDLVCAVKDFNGEKFDLNKFVNPNASFIAHKTVGSTSIKALELPGLWNGGMEHWNTVFVEVPIETFNPVKTVNDLLREEHQ